MDNLGDCVDVFTPQRILIVAAHPDDEILGCGGTAARLVQEGVQVTTLILGEGITSRDGDFQAAHESLSHLKEQAKEANSIIGVSDVTLCDFPDNRFDTVPRLDIVKRIEKEITRWHPDAIFTHHGGDLNIDHQITHQAVLTAARPLPGACVRAIFAFEVLSSTEWSIGYATFEPDVYVDITSYLDIKLGALERYEGEMRSFPHTRSLRVVRALAEKRGTEVGLEAAEAFKLVRMVL